MPPSEPSLNPHHNGQHSKAQGSTVIGRDDGIVLVPEHREPTLIERFGLLVVAGPAPVEIPDHRSSSEQQLARFDATLLDPM